MSAPTPFQPSGSASPITSVNAPIAASVSSAVKRRWPATSVSRRCIRAKTTATATSRAATRTAGSA